MIEPETHADAGWLAALDRELLISAFCHDVRGPLTALDGACELAAATDHSTLRLATQRLGGLVERFSERPERILSSDLQLPGVPKNTPVRLAMLPEPLYVAARLAKLPAAKALIQDSRLVLRFELARESGPTEWTMPIARAWLAEGGPALDLARVRVAARMCGGSSTLEESGLARGLLTLVFARDLPKQG